MEEASHTGSIDTSSLPIKEWPVNGAESLETETILSVITLIWEARTRIGEAKAKYNNTSTLPS